MQLLRMSDTTFKSRYTVEFHIKQVYVILFDEKALFIKRVPKDE